MKKFFKVLLAAVALCAAVGPRWGFAAQRVAGDQLFNETALAYTKNSTVLNTDQIDNLSLQAVISSYVPVARTVFDGVKSTASITISSNSVAGRRVAINGTTFTEGVNFIRGATSSDTAKALSDAIMGDNRLNTIIASTWSLSGTSGVVTATAAATGVNAYALFTSTPAAIQLNGSLTNTTDTFLNGRASDIVANTFTSTNHGFSTGLDVLFSTVAGSVPPQNLVNGTTYFSIRDTASTFRLSTTRALATAATPTAITVSTFTGSGSFTLTPLALAGSPAFKIQVSNDSTNWFDLNVTSVTFASPYTSTNQFWDLGTPSYGYLRAAYVLGTQGGVALTLTANGRKSGQ